jgi:hypothetical protein
MIAYSIASKSSRSHPLSVAMAFPRTPRKYALGNSVSKENSVFRASVSRFAFLSNAFLNSLKKCSYEIYLFPLIARTPFGLVDKGCWNLRQYHKDVLAPFFREAL